MMLKYKLNRISTMPYVQIMIFDVNKDLNQPRTGTGTLFYITVTSIISDVFPNASQKLALSALPTSSLERASQCIPDVANKDTYQSIVLVHTYIYNIPR